MARCLAIGKLMARIAGEMGRDLKGRPGRGGNGASLGLGAVNRRYDCRTQRRPP